MTGKASGVATALAELLGAPAATADDQASLFDPAEYGDELPGPTTAIAKSGPQGGRPKGARNKSTEEIRRYITARYKHPLIALAEMWSRTPTELAQEMDLWEYRSVAVGDGGGSVTEKYLATGEAARLQQQAIIAALPYLAQKMPIEIATKGDKRGVLVLGDFNVTQVAVDGLPLPAERNGDDERVIDVSPLGGDGV